MNFEEEEKTIFTEKEKEKNETINPNNFNILFEGCYANCTEIKYIKIPTFITEIQENCFLKYVALKSIDIPSVIKIQKYCFSGCYSLEKIELPKTLTFLDDYSFSDCTSLKQIYLPSTLSHIGDWCFSNCIKLNSFKFPTLILNTDVNLFKQFVIL